MRTVSPGPVLVAVLATVNHFWPAAV